MPDQEKKNRINENYIFVQAYQLYKKAKVEEDHNFIKALNLYKQAIGLVESIPEKFPASDLAIKIAQEKVTLGMDSIAQLRDNLDSLRNKARKEELLTILHDCASNLTIHELKAEMLEELALLFWENKQESRALKFFSEAYDSIEKIDNQTKRNDSLNRLAIKYSEVKEYERALTLSAFFSDLSDQIRLLMDLGKSYLEQKQKARAIQLFNNALDLVERSSNEDLRDANLAWVAFKLAESTEFFWAIEVCETIQNDETRVVTLQQIASTLVELGQLSNIQEIIERVSENKIKSELLATLAAKYAAQGYFSQSREIASKIETPSFKARALISIASEYKGKQLVKISTGMIDEALELVDSITILSEKILILTSAVVLSDKFNDSTKALNLVKRAIELSDKLNDLHQKSELLAYIQKCVLDIGQLELACEILEKIEEKETRDTAVINIAIKLSELDRFADSLKALNSISDIYTRLNAFFQLINHNPSNRNFKKKYDLINGTLKIAKTINEQYKRDKILSECAIFMAKFEKFHYSLQTLEAIVDNDVRDETIWKLANIKFDSGFFVEGIEVMRLIMDTNKKIAGLIKTGIKILTLEEKNPAFGPAEFLPIAFAFWLEESNRKA